MALSTVERTLVRRAVFGTTTISPRTTPPINEDFNIETAS
jgi:hypothetical protein